MSSAVMHSFDMMASPVLVSVADALRHQHLRIILLAFLVTVVIWASFSSCDVEAADDAGFCPLGAGYTQCEIYRDTRAMLWFGLGALHCKFMLSRGKEEPYEPALDISDDTSEGVNNAQACACLLY
mmetsp:Transcript_82832/g.130510  ORF Transcript_82832/g.130510 Transcript_82832/m.130510 type:complete len:126 (-) Transcript_82832:299-676(-)|eukprot:CAMPEP_0169114488 /NCGR_PEP_ID=MMETSP1015-20121227/28784_1 /TAXON_ID=342587 /ORGANISM="Karlodinium micrum, Strain CCMP2283" /LENGTH=125 /DNA_ID=CAMNT_0009176773 /DNA_START=81 /DNA_END=458 /DNA_ORIENTATION=+